MAIPKIQKSTCVECKEQRILNLAGFCIFCEKGRNFGGYEIKNIDNVNIQGTEIKSATGRLDENLEFRK